MRLPLLLEYGVDPRELAAGRLDGELERRVLTDELLWCSHRDGRARLSPCHVIGDATAAQSPRRRRTRKRGREIASVDSIGLRGPSRSLSGVFSCQFPVQRIFMRTAWTVTWTVDRGPWTVYNRKFAPLRAGIV